jgi:hypothetical protein
MLVTAARRRRTITLSLLTTAILLLGLVPPPADAGDGYRTKLLRIVNASRERRALRPVRINSRLSKDSMRHTRRMINEGRIFDPPNLEEILAKYEWDDIGADVVGCAATLKELHDVLMTDGYHRTILLHKKIRRVGIGVIRVEERNRCGRGAFWATEIFYG